MLVFNRARATPGERVTAFFGQRRTGRWWPAGPISGVRVYFVPMALAKSALNQRSTGLPRNKRIVPLGPLLRDRRHFAALRFRVPRVRPGDYTTGFLCLPCARPRGAFFTSAPPGERWAGRRYDVVIRIGRR